MPSAFDVSQLAPALAGRGLDLASFGGAYLVLLVNLACAAACFWVARAELVITPNRAARSYGAYTAVVLLAVVAATVLENELATASAALPYAALPHLLLLLIAHLQLCRRTEPRTIAIAATAAVGAFPALLAAELGSGGMTPAYLIAAVALAVLLGFLWLKSISTRRAFINARSIYAKSKERAEEPEIPQRPWLGLPQWLGLVGASVLLAALNSVLRGYAVDEIPALQVVLESALLLGVTAAVCAVPAAVYWFSRRAWMPELTRFAWLVWIVVSFSFTYGNYLTRLDTA